MKQDSESR